MEYLPLLPILFALLLVPLLVRRRKRHDRADAPDQFRIVMRSRFEKKRLLSRAELEVFRVIEAHLPRCGPGYRLMAQPSLGEILTAPSDDAFRCINAKRLDMLVIDTFAIPVLAIEHQGGGHYQSDAAARDAVKREALRRAGIECLEIFDHHQPDDIRSLVSGAIARSKPPVSPLSTAAP